MDMFPVTRAPDAKIYSRQLEKAVVASATTGGYDQTRPQYSRGRYIFVTGWTDLTKTEVDSIEAFFLVHQGIIFNWVDIFGTTYEVRFVDKALPQMVQSGFVGGEVVFSLLPINLKQA